MTLHVTAVNLTCNGGIAILNDGQILPITNYGDDDDNVCTRDEAFTWFVCGPSNEGLWYTECIDEFKWQRHLHS